MEVNGVSLRGQSREDAIKALRGTGRMVKLGVQRLGVDLDALKNQQPTVPALAPVVAVPTVPVVAEEPEDVVRAVPDKEPVDIAVATPVEHNVASQALVVAYLQDGSSKQSSSTEVAEAPFLKPPRARSPREVPSGPEAPVTDDLESAGLNAAQYAYGFEGATSVTETVTEEFDVQAAIKVCWDYQ